MVRVVLGGEGLDGFTPSKHTDQYINALFAPDGAPYSPPFDVDLARGLAAELRPRNRRYTVRSWDPDRRELTIDFVAHGDTGYAGRWAQDARPGDRLQFSGPGGGYHPDPDADWHLLVGDESALPAIAASVERLSPGARCVVVGIVDGPDHELRLTSAADMDVHWLHRDAITSPDDVVDAVRALDWPRGRVDVFVHGEAGEVRAVRRFLLAERDIDPAAASISPYWRRDHTDEAWRQIKRQWLQDQATDA